MDKKEEELKKRKEALLKKRKIEALKKKKIEEQKKLSKEKINSNIQKEERLVSDKERIEIYEGMKKNSLAVFARYKFYKDGYFKTLGILIFTFLTFFVSFYFLYYSLFAFKAPNDYFPVNSINQLVEPVPLSEPLFSDNEIRKFSTEALSEITDYNYVTVDSNYFSKISKWFTPKSFEKYREDFKNSSEIKTVKKNYFVLNNISIKEATINKKEGDKIRKKSPVYLWVVNFKSRRVYQNRTGFTYEDYDTRMIITRSPVTVNEKGLAVHSIVNEKVSK